MPYILLPDIAIADVAFEATGKDLTELFAAAAQAYIDLSADPNTIEADQERSFTLTEKSPDRLLFNFLEELVYLKDADFVVFSRCDVQVTEKSGAYALIATLKCASINPETQKLKMDVKAVTQHLFTVEHSAKGWRAVVVLDI